MKNFILRLLGSYIMYVMVGAINVYFSDDKYAGYYGKEGGFRWSIVLVYPIESLIGSVIFYFLLAYISNKNRRIFLLIMLICLTLIIIGDVSIGSYIKENIFILLIYYICLFSIPQFSIPNFHYKEHKLDIDKEYIKHYLFAIFGGFTLLIYYIFGDF